MNKPEVKRISDRGVKGREFAVFAQTRLELWKELVGAAVEHQDFGLGIIVSVTPRAGYIPLIGVRFASDATATSFNSESFVQGVFVEIHISESISLQFLPWQAQWAADEARRVAEAAQEHARKAADEAAREELRQLASKYHVSERKLGFTPLAAILLKLEAGDLLQKSEEEWLEAERIFNVLATYQYRQFKKTGDGWKLVRACGNLRRARLPEKSLEISESRYMR